ncbi:hypothetical protein [Anaeroselena agilis]|uniref:FeoB-associated Cys-rich membrane protein n=1 Tax=Anaeroselena agilis TaxID=3063788 RepID=A0ABU3NSI3_9FIRM|nr:hypothetical protein [Selenomonadales bacterium 4137-cl]
METMVLTGVGAAALGYVVYVAWRGASGKSACACGSDCRKAGGSCQCGPESRTK